MMDQVYELQELAMMNGADPLELSTAPGWWQWSESPESVNAWHGELPDIFVKVGDELPGSGWPAAVPVRPGNWDVGTSSYKLAWGDTLAGLAATYLGSPQRWKEIWNEQSDTFRTSNNPDELTAGTWIRMPLDALATLCAATGACDSPPGGKPATPPPGGWKPTGPPSKPTPGTPLAKKPDNTMLYAGGAAALVAAYLLFRKK